MAGNYVLAIDQGTTGTTVLVFDHDGALVGRSYSEFTQHYPHPGWVEHDANEIWATVQATMAEIDQPIAASTSQPSARRSSCGPPAPASRCTAPSCGRTGAPPIAASSSASTCRSC